MILTIHRGSREIGGSCVELKSRNSRIVIDIGVPIVTPSGKKFNIKDYKNLSHKELIASKIIPNVKGLYKQNNINNIDGLLISHAHIDHYGLYNFVDKDIQYYLGEATHRLIGLSNIFIEDRGTIKKYTYIKDGTPFQIGGFTITPYLMDHSAFDAYAFLIEAEGKKLFYSGDFRSHGRKGKLFYKFLRTAPEGINALLLEGTRIEGRSSTFRTEQDVEGEIVKMLKENDSIVFGISSTQNIDRLVSFFKAAQRTKRIFAIDVYTANILSELKDFAKLPYPSKNFSNIKVFFPKNICDKLARVDSRDLMIKFKTFKITRKEISDNRSKILMMIRPSMTFDLSRIKDIEGASVIYSMWKGYLKDKSMEAFIRFKEKKGLELVQIHTSGHADVATLKELVDITKPKKIIPIHTTNPHLYKNLFPNVVEASDGIPIDI